MRGTGGAGAPRGVSVAVGGGRIDSPEDRLCAAGLAEWVSVLRSMLEHVQASLRPGAQRIKSFDRQVKELRWANEMKWLNAF